MRKCAKPGCRVRVSDGFLACRPHWFELPQELREEIYANFRSRDRVAYRRALVDALGQWGVGEGVRSKQT